VKPLHFRDCSQKAGATLHVVSPARHTIAVASGKGGVGKSTVTVQLALALRSEGARVGVLDADFYGPDIPVMLNVTRKGALKRWDLWRGGDVRLEPLERSGLKLMSVGLLLGERQSLPFAAQSLQLALRQFLHGTEWGELDYLLVDLPPGTADLQQEVFRVLALSGVILVVGPQDVAHLDAKRLLDLLTGAGVRVLGAVENMSGLACPHCGERVEVFPRVRDDRSIWQLGVTQLATLPIDPALGQIALNGGGVPAEFLALAQTVREALSVP
jgi:ATP-binding protein involved in chromosome partitioning